MNLTEQPPTVPERFKEGRYLGFKGCVVDAEERGDHNTLGLRGHHNSEWMARFHTQKNIFLAETKR